MHKSIKKFTLLTVLFWFFPIFCFAATASLGFDIWPTQDNAESFVGIILAFLLRIIGYLSLAFVVIGAILYLLGGAGAGNEKLITAGKNCVIGALVGLAVAAGGPTFLKQINLIVFGSSTMPPLSDINQAPSLVDVFTRLLTFLLSIIGLLAIIGTVISGVAYLTAGGDGGRAETAKKSLTASIIGVAIAGGAIILITQVAKFFA